MAKYIFDRVEKKYVISETQYKELIERLKGKMQLDKYGFSTICNIYFDTNNYELIRTSLDKPVYKEKIRLRSYGVPTLESKVFLEIKKKYKGVVNKRRIEMTLQEAYDYIDRGIIKEDTQIMREIDYCFKRYDLKPAIYLAYDRYAYQGLEDPEFRVTFDFNIRSRDNDLRLEKGDYGDLLSDEPIYVMEVKTLGSIPMWFVKILSELQIYPHSFSKYGEIYKEKIG